MAYDKLARKGRYGDDRIREVLGRKSHVNRKESDLIDLYGMLGERLVRDAGAGTTNPKTGLPEYHIKRYYKGGPRKIGNAHNQAHDGGRDPHKGQREQRRFEGAGDKFNKAMYIQELQKPGDAGNEYLRSIGVPENKLEYFESNINMDEVTLAKEAQTLSETQAEEGFALGMEQAGLTAGKGLMDIKQQGDVAIAQSDFATQGSITSTTKSAKGGIFKDYTMQQKQLAEARSSAMASADITYKGAMSSWGQRAADEWWETYEATV